MSRRVYEVARESGLSTKEVMGRLNEAGVEVKSNLSVVEDTAYERVFGNGPRDAAPEGPQAAREAEAPPRRMGRSRILRAMAYVLVAVLAFFVAAGAGAMVPLVLRGDLALPWEQEPRVPGEREDVSAPREEGAAVPESAPREKNARGDEGVGSAGTPSWEVLQGCERSQEACARDFVAGVAPEAEYVGGRIEADDSGQTRNVLYFVDPGLAPCEHRRLESAADGAAGTHYVVLIAGEGSFDQQQQGDEAGCLPEL